MGREKKQIVERARGHAIKWSRHGGPCKSHEINYMHRQSLKPKREKKGRVGMLERNRKGVGGERCRWLALRMERTSARNGR